MKCIFCGYDESKVIDSRSTEETNSIRRRRECLNCGRRYTTYETAETSPMLVIKNNGDRERFDARKVKAGIMKACEKRPVSIQQIDTAVAEIEKKVYQNYEDEVSSKTIGEYVMSELSKLDEVSYVRFASIYKKFKDVSTFFEFVAEYERMLNDTKI